MAIGRTGSFATIAPIQGNPIGNAVAQVEDNAFKYRAEQRLAEEKKKLAEDKANAELEADLGKIKSDTTKFSTQNALIIDATTKLKNGIGQKARELKAGKISQTDYNIYKTNAEMQVSLIDQAAKRINAQATAYAKDVAEGKIPSGFEENALNFGGAYDKNNIVLELNPDGTMTSVVYDDDGKILDKGDLSTIGQNAFTPVYKYDLDKDKQEFIKTYPKVLNEKFVGNTKVGTKGIADEIEKAMDLKIEATVKDRNALAIKAKEITGKANPNVKDPEIIEQVRKKLKDEYMGLYAPEKTVDEATGRSTEARLQREADKKANKDKVAIEIVETPPVYEKSGVTPIPGYKTVSVVGGKPIQQITAYDNKKGSVIKMDTAFLNSYTVAKNPKTGERAIVAEITYPDYKSAGYTAQEQANFKIQLDAAENQEQADLILSKATKPISYKTTVAYLTEKDASKYLGVGGFKDVNEMKDKARFSQKDEQPKQSNIPTYSRADLKANGWNDSQIKQAVKLGKIKVN
jgi:chorismate mutase